MMTSFAVASAITVPSSLAGAGAGIEDSFFYIFYGAAAPQRLPGFCRIFKLHRHLAGNHSISFMYGSLGHYLVKHGHDHAAMHNARPALIFLVGHENGLSAQSVF